MPPPVRTESMSSSAFARVSAAVMQSSTILTATSPVAGSSILGKRVNRDPGLLDLPDDVLKRLLRLLCVHRAPLFDPGRRRGRSSVRGHLSPHARALASPSCEHLRACYAGRAV
jgi:hypothetical protein